MGNCFNQSIYWLVISVAALVVPNPLALVHLPCPVIDSPVVKATEQGPYHGVLPCSAIHLISDSGGPLYAR